MRSLGVSICIAHFPLFWAKKLKNSFFLASKSYPNSAFIFSVQEYLCCFYENVQNLTLENLKNKLCFFLFFNMDERVLA